MNAKERLKAAQEEWRKIDLARAKERDSLRETRPHGFERVQPKSL